MLTISVKLPNTIGRKCLNGNPKMLHKLLHLLAFTTNKAVWCIIFASELWERQILFVYYSELLINSVSSVWLTAEIKPESQSPHPEQVHHLGFKKPSKLTTSPHVSGRLRTTRASGKMHCKNCTQTPRILE